MMKERVKGIFKKFFLPSKETREKCVKAVLMVLAAFLVFGGPTYLLYVLQRVAVPHSLLTLLGLASIVVGLFLFTRLIKEKK